LRGDLELLGVLQGWVFDIELIARTGALLDVSEAMIDLNALQPVAERGATLEVADAEIGFDEDFLGKIFGAVGVAGQVAAVGDNLLLVKLDQRLKSTQIALAGTLGLGEKLGFVRELG
jgi:hypothetical protein